ncbi:MAG: hypothetical protein Kow0089_14500 [Desulfobulbaceae bacterium]
MIELDREDRRSSVRLEFASEVIVETGNGGRAIKGELVNLGIGGMAMKCDETMERGTPCKTSIVIRDNHSELVIREVTGEIVRADNGEVAVRFDHRFEWLALFHVYHSKSDPSV